MQYTTLKKTNIKISNIGLGTNAVGGHNLFKNLNEEEGKNFVRKAIQLGVTFIDTADLYGNGRSEELVGEVIKEFPRNQLVVATKGGNKCLEDGAIVQDNTPAYLRSALEQSLKRLQMDYVDLYYIHFPDGVTPLGEAIGELFKLKAEGKIRAIGVSNLSLEQLKEANESNEISAFQISYNMLNREIERDILPYCVENEISVVPYGPLAFGILGGNYKKDLKLDEGNWRKGIPLFQEGVYERNIDKVEALKKIAESKGITMANLASSWLLAQKGVDAIIPGGKKPEQVKENVEASEIKFTAQELTAIQQILDKE
jgi:myo-inositol catabolism protein IolS